VLSIRIAGLYAPPGNTAMAAPKESAARQPKTITHLRNVLSEKPSIMIQT
jgi:hypothetical protein